MKIHGRGRRIAAVLAFCVASAVTFTSCSGTGGNGGSTTAPAPAPASSAGQSSEGPSEDPYQDNRAYTVDTLPDTYPMASGSKTVVLQPYENPNDTGGGEVPPGFGVDGDEWSCGDNDISAEAVQVQALNTAIVYRSQGEEISASTVKTDKGLTLKVKPNTRVSGGIVNGKIPFVIPLDEDSGSEGFVESVFLPKADANGVKKFGEVRQLELCILVQPR